MTDIYRFIRHYDNTAKYPTFYLCGYLSDTHSMDDEVTDLSKPLWEHPDWPAFYANAAALSPLESALKAAAKKIPKIEVLDDLMISEVVANSEIEGIHLSQEKLQSSFIRRAFLPAW